jgi:hypothetical protein
VVAVKAAKERGGWSWGEEEEEEEEGGRGEEAVRRRHDSLRTLNSRRRVTSGAIVPEHSPTHPRILPVILARAIYLASGEFAFA